LKTLTIIGGSGFLGKSILDNFNYKKLTKFKINKIISISRNIEKIKKKYNKNKNIKFIKGDIAKIKVLPISDYYIFAATSSEKKKYTHNPQREYLNMTKGLKNFLNLFIKNRNLNSKILFLSSGAIYGPNKKKIKILESKKINLKNYENFSPEKKIYAYGKYMSEKLIKNFVKKFGIKIGIARCFAFYGSSIPEDGHFFLSNIIRPIKNDEPIKLYSNKLKFIFRSYMHTDDMVIVFMNILEKQGSNLAIYNVGSDTSYSLYYLLKKIRSKFNIKINIPRQIPKSEIDFYIPDIKKIKNKYNFSCKKKFFEEFRKLILIENN
jgi:nucleoside-diphosphate-sugar epimerase